MSKYLFRLDVISLGLVSLVFILFPKLDLALSSKFFQPEQGFYLAETFFPQLVLVGVVYLAKFFIILISALTLGAYLFKKTKLTHYRVRLLFVFVAMMVGPTLIVNTLVKENSGRARPSHIQQFEGERSYSAPFRFSNQCNTNCSFVSGHAAVGFFFLCFGFVSAKYRRHWFYFGLSFGLIVGLGRMMSGSHFLSDVLYSGFVCWFSILGVYNLFRKKIDMELRENEISY